MTPLRGMLFGGLVVAILDIGDAFVYYGLRGISPTRILQSIASGLLGRAAYSGGWPTAALGAGLQLFIATTIVFVYVLASRKLAVLHRRPWIFGPLYGVAVYLVMNLVVRPLSAAGPPKWLWPVVVNGLFAHLFLVGLPSALVARRVEAGRHD